ncbi:MAG: putative ABC transport system permease protein [Arcticibacterium sp.]|jgi:putative ABC transport system permease protein
MGMTLLAGKNFTATSRGENREVIVNEEAIRLWGIPDAKEAVGKELKFWGSSWTILGVIQDYQQLTAKSDQAPIIHTFNDNWFRSVASISFSGGSPQYQVENIKSVYNASFPGAPFEYFFQDAEYDKLYKADERFQSVFSVLTAFAILIACLGLLGLASFTVAKRTKEIGIRKVIGASTSNLLYALSSEFLKTVLLSMLIGIPLTYFIIRNWQDNYANRNNLVVVCHSLRSGFIDRIDNDKWKNHQDRFGKSCTFFKN